MKDNFFLKYSYKKDHKHCFFMITELICEIIEFDWLKRKVILWNLEKRIYIHDNP